MSVCVCVCVCVCVFVCSAVAARWCWWMSHPVFTTWHHESLHLSMGKAATINHSTPPLSHPSLSPPSLTPPLASASYVTFFLTLLSSSYFTSALNTFLPNESAFDCLIYECVSHFILPVVYICASLSHTPPRLSVLQLNYCIWHHVEIRVCRYQKVNSNALWKNSSPHICKAQ